MSSVFARIFLDEDIDPLVGDMLRSHGFEVTTTQGEGRKGCTDQDQMLFAAENRFLLLTHNRQDFEIIAREYFENGRSHYGIVVAVQRPPRELAKRLLMIVNKFTADELRDQLFYI